MKIGIFTECYKPMLNGVVHSILNFKKGLEDSGHEVYIFAPTYKGYRDAPADKNIIRLKSIPIPKGRGYQYILPIHWTIKGIIKELDLIHLQHPFIIGSRIAPLAKKLNLPLVFTNHTQYENYAHYLPLPSSFVKTWIRKYMRQFSQKCDLIIAPAEGIKKLLLSYGVKTDIEIVPNGIDIDKFKKTDISFVRKAYELSNWPIFIYVGRIAKEKNLEFLIDACKELFKNDSRFYLLLVGGGPEEEYFRTKVKELGLEKNIIMTGAKSYQEVPNYLAGSDIFVTASKTEVHPLTVLEAMAAGLPCVIVQAPGTGDVVTDRKNGLVAKEKTKDYSAGLGRLMQNQKLRQKLSNNALKTARQYSIEETTKKLVGVYQKAIVIRRLPELPLR